MPGFGRFSRKKQLSQESNAPAAAAAPSATDGGGQPNDTADATAVANNGPGDVVVDAPPAARDGERPSTAFNSFDSDRPPTAGSHGFSAIGGMFGGVGGMGMDDGDDDAGAGGFAAFGVDPAEAGGGMMDCGFGFGGDDGGGGGFGGCGGFETSEQQQQQQQQPIENGGTDSNDGAETKPPAVAAEALPVLPPSKPAGFGGGALGGLLAKKRAAASASAATAPVTARATTNAPTVAVATVPPALAPAHAVSEQPPAQNDAEMRPPPPPKTDAGLKFAESSSVANLSRFDTGLLSKAGTENATSPVEHMAVVADNDGALGAEQGVGGGERGDANANEFGEEVPKTIAASGDEIDDDLTEATAATLANADIDFSTMGMGGEVGAPHDPSNESSGERQQEPSSMGDVSKNTSPYFANMTNNDNQAVVTEQGGFTSNDDSGVTEKTGVSSPLVENVSTEAPREEAIFPGMKLGSIQEPSPSGDNMNVIVAAGASPDAGAKAGAGAGAGASAVQEFAKPVEPMDVSKPAPDPTNMTAVEFMICSKLASKPVNTTSTNGGDKLSPHKVSTQQRMSMSPTPGPKGGNNAMNKCRSSLLSPKGRSFSVPRPRLNVGNQAASFMSPNGPHASAPRPAAASIMSPKGQFKMPRPGHGIAKNQGASAFTPKASNTKGPRPTVTNDVDNHMSSSFSLNGNNVSNTGQNNIMAPGMPTAMANVKSQAVRNSSPLANKDFSANLTETGGDQGTLSLRQKPAARVSLSPQPGPTKTVTKNQAPLLSPEAHAKAPSLALNNAVKDEAAASSMPKSSDFDMNLEEDDDDTSIVIPGFPTAVANKTAQSGQNTTVQANESNIGTKGEVAMNRSVGSNPGGHANDSSLVSFVSNKPAGNPFPPKSSQIGNLGVSQLGQPGQRQHVLAVSANNGGFKANLQHRQKPSLMLNKGRMPSRNASAPVALSNMKMQNANPNPTVNFRSTGNFSSKSNNVEKVKFAVPANRPATKSATNTPPMSNNRSFNKANGQFSSNPNTFSNVTTAPNSTAITPDHRQSKGSHTQTNTAVTPYGRGTNQLNAAVTPTPHKAPAPTVTNMHDGSNLDRVIPGMSTHPTNPTGQTGVEVKQPQVEKLVEAPPHRRPRSQTVYSPPPSTSPGSSVTPKASNVNNNPDPAEASFSGTNSAFHTDENLDALLEQFVQDIQEGTDVYEKGQNDLLELDVDLSHAFSGVLRYKEEYTNLLLEIEGIQAMALEIMSENEADIAP